MKALWALPVLLLGVGCATTPGAPQRPLPDKAQALAALAPQTVYGQAWSREGADSKVLAVIFFATWCFPCLTELGVMRQLDEALAAKGLLTVGVGMDLEGARVLVPFLEVQPLAFPVVVADQPLRTGESAFGPLRELPTRFLFARDGRLVAAWSGAADPAVLRARIDAELAKPAR